MKKLIIVALILIIICLGCWALIRHNSVSCPSAVILPVGEKEVHGPVVSVFEDMARVDSGSKKSERTALINYDHQGRRVKILYYGSQGGVIATDTFSYAGKAIFAESTSGTAPEFRDLYVYEPNKHEVIKQTYTFDTKGVAMKTRRHRSWLDWFGHKPMPGQMVAKVVTKLDQQYRRMEDLDYNAQTGKLETVRHYKYDSNGNLVSSVSNLGGTPGACDVSYTNDSHGNLVKYVSRVDGKIFMTEVYAYNYDYRGNWIEMTTTRIVYGDKKIKPRHYITTRRIAYR